MNKQMIICLLVLAGIIFGSEGCATMMASSKPTMRIKITSEPPEAKIKIDNEVKGITPLEINLPKGRMSYQITATKDGYEPATQNVGIWTNGNVYLNMIPYGVGLFAGDPTVMLLGILGGSIGWIVDYGSDNWYKADRETLDFTLEPKK
ncbi:MAG: PEGA domain-containing protein [Planctomycetota bacterium]